MPLQKNRGPGIDVRDFRRWAGSRPRIFQIRQAIARGVDVYSESKPSWGGTHVDVDQKPAYSRLIDPDPISSGILPGNRYESPTAFAGLRLGMSGGRIVISRCCGVDSRRERGRASSWRPASPALGVERSCFAGKSSLSLNSARLPQVRRGSMLCEDSRWRSFQRVSHDGIRLARRDWPVFMPLSNHCALNTPNRDGLQPCQHWF